MRIFSRKGAKLLRMQAALNDKAQRLNIASLRLCALCVKHMIQADIMFNL